MAEKIMKAHSGKLELDDQTTLFDDVISRFRWFLLPSEAHDFIISSQKPVKSFMLPFQVKCEFYNHGELVCC